jgi:hypothetical protein
MEEWLERIWHDLGGRVGGPLTFRLIIQPIVAVFLALRSDIKHGRGSSTYIWSILTDERHRRELLRDGWKDIARLFVLVVVMDLIYQVIVFRWIYPFESFIVAVVLAVLPYLVIRGPVNRLIQHWRKPSPRNSAP